MSSKVVPPQVAPPQAAIPQARSSYYLPVASNIASPVNQGSGQILLPDLGDEPEPTKKPVDKGVAERDYINPRTGAPYGAPNTSFGSGVPNLNGGQGGGNANPLPGLPNAQAPGASPALNLGSAGAGANITPTATNLHYESKDFLAHVGVDYVTPKSNFGLGIKADGAALLSKTFAVGANLTFNNINEAVLSGTWMPEDTNIKAKLSTAYMWGQQNFGFYTGNSNASLTQASYYFSTQYVVPKEKSDYLHSVGVSTWGSKANQTNTATPIYGMTETATAYNIIMDPQRLAVGTLQGEALDAQVGITKQVTAKASMGYETLKFPFSDGSQELNKRAYQDYVLQYQPIQEVSLQAGYKMGAAMNNVMLSAAYAQWKLTGFKNNGNNGVIGNQGLMLTYSIPLDGKTQSTAFGSLTRPEITGNSSFILRDAATRPVQLPQAFLAKVDTTAVKTVATINKLGAPGVTVNSAGQALVNVGIGGGVISGVTRNGASFAYASAISATSAGVIINPLALPAAASGGDAYVVSITDSNNIAYLVNFTTAN